MSKNTPHKGFRPTWAEVDLSAIAHNLGIVSRLVNPGVKIMACVKADAYGHGLIPVSKKLVSCGADYLGVASIEEGLLLREAGIRKPILILGLISQKDIPALFRFRLMPTVCQSDFACALAKEAQRRARRFPIHIKVDTGMHRIGVLCDKAPGLIKEIAALKNIIIEGIFTHLACADTDRKFTLGQIKLFKSVLEKVKACGIRIPLAHAANSMGVIAYKESHFNMVRPGLMLYGLYPKETARMPLLRPALSLKTRVVYVKRLPAGSGISYGHTYITRTPASIVTLPIGYGDGYPRNLSNLAPVLIKGRVLRISGRVCMDQLMVDAGNMKVSTGDEAVLIGRQGNRNISAERLATLAGTIPYEIVCGLGSRIPRIYG